MNMNEFENQNSSSGGGTYFETPRWNDFTIADETRAKRRFSRFFLSVFIYMLAASLTAVAIELIISLVMGDAASKVFENIFYVWGLNVFAMYIVAFPIFYLITRKMKNTVRAKSKMSVKDFIVFFLISQAFMMIGGVIGNILNSIISVFVGHDITNTTSELIEGSPIWLIILVAVIIGPIVEELIFRKFLMDKLGMYGDRIAIIISAISFGIFHGNLYQLFYATLLGFVLAYIYSKTSNIIYPIVMHMLINFVGSVLPLPLIDKIDRYYELYDIMLEQNTLPDALMEEFTQLTMIVGTYSFIQWGMAIAGLVLLYRGRRKFFISDRCEILIPKERRANVILCNVGVILFIALMIVNMILNIVLV